MLPVEGSRLAPGQSHHLHLGDLKLSPFYHVQDVSQFAHCVRFDHGKCSVQMEGKGDKEEEGR